MNQWKKDKDAFIKETDNEFMAISYLTFVGAEDDEYLYGPTLHKINKLHYPIKSINEIISLMFESNTDEMSLSKKIIHLSAFVGSCEDIEDSKGERIWITFKNKREASTAEIEEKILSIIKELNL